MSGRGSVRRGLPKPPLPRTDRYERDADNTQRSRYGVFGEQDDEDTCENHEQSDNHHRGSAGY